MSDRPVPADRMTDPLLFSLAVLALLATPGPTNTLLATSGAMIGLRRSLPLIAAEAIGYAGAIGSLHVLLGPALAVHPGLQSGLRVAVGLWLLTVATGLWREREKLVPTGSPVGFVRVLVTTWLNPKAAVFAFGILPLSAPDPWPHLVGFGVLVALVGLGWILVGVGLGGLAGDARRWFSRMAALVLTLFAGLIVAG